MMSEPAIHAFAGGLGGITAMTLTYPLVNISTRLAVDRSEQKDQKQQSKWHGILESIRQDGLLSLFDGLESSLLAIATTNILFYASYEQSKRLLLRLRRASVQHHYTAAATVSTIESILTSLAAGTFTTLLVNPIWIINTRQTISSGQLSANETIPRQRLSFVKTLQLILQTDGLRGLFKGLKPALILVLNPVLQYSLFEQLRNILALRKKARNGRPLADLDFFLLGAISKLFATGITYPYVLLRSRQHVSRSQGSEASSVGRALLDIVRREGVSGLYKGAQFKLTQSVLTSAILFASKERFYQLSKAALRKSAAVAKA